MKLPKKYRLKLEFTLRLLAFGLFFYGLWSLSPSFDFLKLFTATLVSYTTGSKLIVSGMDGVFLSRGGFKLQIVTDCTAWKELAVFLALFLSWPKKKDYWKALFSVIAILLYNLIRLDFLVLFSGGFDYYHPAFQYFSVALILFLWTWSVGITKIKFGVKFGRRKYKKKKKRK